MSTRRGRNDSSKRLASIETDTAPSLPSRTHKRQKLRQKSDEEASELFDWNKLAELGHRLWSKPKKRLYQPDEERKGFEPLPEEFSRFTLGIRYRCSQDPVPSSAKASTHDWIHSFSSITGYMTPTSSVGSPEVEPMGPDTSLKPDGAAGQSGSAGQVDRSILVPYGDLSGDQNDNGEESFTSDTSDPSQSSSVQDPSGNYENGSSPNSDTPNPESQSPGREAEASMPDDPSPKSPRKSERKKGRATGFSENNGTSETTALKTNLSAYDGKAFENGLEAVNIYWPENMKKVNGKYCPEPANFRELIDMLKKPRPEEEKAGDFGSSSHEVFMERNAEYFPERGVMSNIIPLILGDTADQYHSCEDKKLSLARLGCDFTALQPDKCDGEPRGSFSEVVKSVIGTYIITCKDPCKKNCGDSCKGLCKGEDLPHAPNFFLEAKQPQQDQRTPTLQTVLPGAAGERAMRRLLNFPFLRESRRSKDREIPSSDGREIEPPKDGYAHTLAWTFVDGVITIYCYHMLEIGSKVYTFGTELKEYSISKRKNGEVFKEALIAVRNAREWARDQRLKAIVIANNKADKLASSMKKLASNKERKGWDMKMTRTLCRPPLYLPRKKRNAHSKARGNQASAVSRASVGQPSANPNTSQPTEKGKKRPRKSDESDEQNIRVPDAPASGSG